MAKKMMLVLSDSYRRQYGFDSCAPIVANLYGPDDSFDLEDSHVVPALIRRYVEARQRGEARVTLEDGLERTIASFRDRAEPEPAA